MESKSKAKLLIFCGIWIVLALLIAGGYKLVYQPLKAKMDQSALVESEEKEKASLAEQEKIEEQKERALLSQTASQSRYKYTVNFGIDSFSGYSVFRSDDFQKALGVNKIKMNLHDDGADYKSRLQDLKDNKINMAVFTIDALIKASSEMGELPATIIFVTDETRRADAMVAYKSAIPNVDALNSPDVNFVLTKNSPSETLARVVMSNFSLDLVDENSFVGANGAEDVYKKLLASDPTKHNAYVLWEPYVTKALSDPNVHVLVDSSRFQGYIVDVVVVNRQFLTEHREVVDMFTRSYFSVLNKHSERMNSLVFNDSKVLGSSMSREESEKVAEGIWWKNTVENYHHFGLVDDRKLQLLEDMIVNITAVLIKTGAISSDPTNGRPNLLYFDEVLKAMQSSFNAGTIQEAIKDFAKPLPALTDRQWDALAPVGKLNVQEIRFSRGRPDISEESYVILDRLIDTLATWPDYYVVVSGNVSNRGDVEANKELSLMRAEAVRKYLAQKGVSSNRMKVKVGKIGKISSVEFVLGESPN